MKTSLFAGILFAVIDAAAEPSARAASPLRERLTDELIASAVRETLAEDGAQAAPARGGTVLSGDRYRNFSRAFTESKKPSCLGADALKFQPAQYDIKGWRVDAKELMALPFWAAAIAGGKCN